MQKNSNSFIYSLILGYALIILLVAIAAGIFFNYESKISSAFKDYIRYTLQNYHVDMLHKASNMRSILLVKMIKSNDPFDIDDLKTKMNQYEREVGVHLNALDKINLAPEQIVILNAAKAKMNENRLMQMRVYDFVMDEDIQHAMLELVEVTLPLQETVQNTLAELQKTIAYNASKAIANYSTIIADMRAMITWVSLPIIFSLVIIGFLTTRKLHFEATKQQDILATLENRVQQRTQELLMDRKLLQHLNEAIGVINQTGALILSNKRFKQLLEQCQIETQASMWPCMSLAFNQIDIAEIQETLKTDKWRSEVSLIHSPRQTLILDIEKIHDYSLPETYYSIILTDISELKTFQNQLEHLANHDAVTGLVNRHNFNSQLRQQIDNHPEDEFFLLYLDLDDFKWVNDHLGHAIGDQFLKKLGEICLQTFATQDTVARIGGDEFAIIIRQPLEEYELSNLANILIHNLQKLNDLHTSEHKINCSIGIARYPKDGTQPDIVLKHADYAMYQSRLEGSNQFCIFSKSMSEHLHYLHEIEQNLHNAVKNQEFSVHYQPQYCLKHLKLIGAEALIRWETKTRSIPPAEFIPMAEKFRLIGKIGEFVFAESIRQFKTWQKTPIQLPRIAINASSIQLLAGNFGPFVEAILQEYQVTANQVDIEVTESVMMKNIEGKKQEDNCLSSLQQQGMEISIDDFGTGYSSLSYIKHLNIDRIKIDKSFIDDIEYNEEARSIVKAIIKMGHSLGLKVLAEGIETQNQLHILQTLECDEGQGYFFSRPLTPENFEAKCLTLHS
ncbi:MAG: EAL domain-containing protein [Thiotrichales bacterium]|nr:EAL domain-containing protein [Thiotrichales bacterium]